MSELRTCNSRRRPLIDTGSFAFDTPEARKVPFDIFDPIEKNRPPQKPPKPLFWALNNRKLKFSNNTAKLTAIGLKRFTRGFSATRNRLVILPKSKKSIIDPRGSINRFLGTGFSHSAPKSTRIGLKPTYIGFSGTASSLVTISSRDNQSIIEKIDISIFFGNDFWQFFI